MTLSDIEIVILGTKKRPILTKECIDVPSTVYYNEDWPAIPFKIPDCAAHISSLPSEPRPYRCFKGHQEALRVAEKDYILLLEDDAVPNRDSWKQIVIDSCELLKKYDYVSLHARDILGINKRFYHKGREYCTLKPISNFQVKNMCWACAALAYLVKKSTVPSIADVKYNGIPFDIWLYNQNACILLDSPFDHDRQHGSIIENRPNNLGIQKSSISKGM